MNEAVEPRMVNYVLTLEELSALTREGGKPAETLMNVVALIARRFQTDVCSAYLLEPDRANLVLAATLGLRRECVGTLRMALHEGLAGLVAEQVRPVAVERGKEASAFQILRRGGRGAIPFLPRGSAGGSRSPARRAGGADGGGAQLSRRTKCGCCAEAAAQVAPVVSEARTLDRFIAPAQERLWALARNLWWSWDARHHQPVPGPGSGALAGAEEQSHFAARRISAGGAGAAGGGAALHSRINYAYRRQQEYLQSGPDVGRDARGRAAAAAGGLLLGGVRAAPIGADLFGRTGGAGGGPYQERVGPGHPVDRDRSVLRAGLFPAAAGSAAAGSRRTTSK